MRPVAATEVGMGSVTFMEPRGHYSAREAGVLAGVSGTTIGQWARRGYITASQVDQPPYDYSYQDIAEAIIVHELLDAGVSHRRVKRAIAALRDRYGNRWPLQTAELGAADGGIVAVEREATWDLGDGIWQRQITPENLLLVAGILRRGGWAARDLPRLEHIEVDPDRLSGRPTIAGRRVSAEMVGQMADEPDGEAELREGFGLTHAEIRDARRWWHAVREYAEAA